MGSESPVVIVQAVRNFGEGEGVGGVVENLERCFIAQGHRCERITLASVGLRRRRSKNLVLDKLFQMRDVIWFSLAGTYVIRRRKRSGDCIVITHGDPVAGDVYVNHGLLKKVMRDRHPRRFSLPRNPMHWFTLLRDEVRYGAWSPHGVIVSLTSLDDAYLEELYPRLSAPRTVITNGIDLEKYDTASVEARARARDRFGFGEDDFVAVFIGHEFERKGLWPTLDALTELGDRFRLLVVGGADSAVRAAEEEVERRNVSNRVTFVGRQPGPMPFLEAADCLVLPTAYEAAPLVMLEALGSGLPVVATPTGLARDLAEDGGANVVIVERSGSSIASGLEQSARNLERLGRPAVADACRNSVQMLSWSRVAERYLRLARDLARGS